MQLNTLLIILAILIIILFTLFIQRKKLKLYWIEKRFGQYSPEFVKAFKKAYGANPFPRASKSEVVEHISVLKNLKEYEVCSTSTIIAFGDYTSDIANINVVKDNGEPDYFTIREIGKYKIKIFGYDVSIFDMRAIALYFVYEDRLFLGEYTIKHENQNVDFKHIANNIQKKYCKEVIPISKDHFLIKDHNASQILLLDDGFAVRIKYFNFENNEILNLLFAEQDRIINTFQKNSISNRIEI